MTSEKHHGKVIALDIGGVCVKLKHPEMFAYFGWKDKVPEGFMETADLMETGVIDEKEWLRKFRKFTDRELSDEDIINGWNIVIGAAMDGMAELLREFKRQGFRLVFFSDTSTLHVKQIFKDPTITSIIDGAVYSYEAGAKKPSAAMFTEFEKRHGKPCLYLDDKAENVEGGQRHGWRAVRFTGVPELRRILEEKPL